MTAPRSGIRTHRSTEAPMDFEFTSRPASTPVWASSSSAQDADPATPKKRAHTDLAPSTPLTPQSHPPAFGFGQNQNIPFLFQRPPPPSPASASAHAWAPPPLFSPEKAFPSEADRDVDMHEASPPAHDAAGAGLRKVATGGMRRVWKSRKAEAERALVPVAEGADGAVSDEDESGDEADAGWLQRTPSRPRSANHNHYTLNMAAPAPPPSHVPYVLLGYLQFFFNLSLVLLFLYLVVQFIWTVQRDVQERISEYSMDIIQDIAQCARHFQNNRCDEPLPAMAAQCAQWAQCMGRDPAIVGRARVGAELIAEVVNGFVEPISWKTLGFTLTSLAFLTLFINTLLSLYRERARPAPLAAPPPQTPHTSAFELPAVTPYQHPAHGGYLSPAATPSWGRGWRARRGQDGGEDEMGTPTRARRRRVEGGGAVKVK
ncbi:Di-sulfide bridge nucleocytoplasmic transport domain-containing protein [Mycena pura]|uniref:Di-sulfide bridge nucleocytoplasmic transport domain-containing protein n=1 Tax=Mycena pura TaxID=153505 RepID=A0AAD6YQG6_9AGAR|nr:Di-sulfide bridge nucleocytoplasmic transport domain-containing protein [Mycena pura]